jgi:D-serine deaminase-like pyridoxal phosphate-dependent protein
VVERNLAWMAGVPATRVSLRPVKTHKCLELGRRQLAHGARGVTVSTLVEAAAFLTAGFDDVTWAFPLDPTHLPHVRRPGDRGTLRVVTDDVETARALTGTGLHVWLKVDCGIIGQVDLASSYASTWPAAGRGARAGLRRDPVPLATHRTAPDEAAAVSRRSGADGGIAELLQRGRGAAPRRRRRDRRAQDLTGGRSAARHRLLRPHDGADRLPSRRTWV